MKQQTINRGFLMGMVFNIAPHAIVELDRAIPRATFLDLPAVNDIFQREINKTDKAHDLSMFNTDSKLWFEHIQKEVLPALNIHFKGVKCV